MTPRAIVAALLDTFDNEEMPSLGFTTDLVEPRSGRIRSRGTVNFAPRDLAVLLTYAAAHPEFARVLAAKILAPDDSR